MPDNHNLATPLNGNLNMQAYIEVLREELERIDPTKLFIFLFDTVDESLLDLLAEQFDMLGFNGWVLAETVEQKRELLKASFQLHSMKGTPAGIREVVRRLGFQDLIINERTGAPVDALNPWAYFTVQYVLSNSRTISEADAANLIGIIDKYKNARSVMADFSFATRQSEVILITETLNLNVIPV